MRKSRASVAFIEKEMGKKFGDSSDPLLLSVRSGSRASMPGMMDTILNLGLNDEAVAGLASKAGNERFAWDSYRRFVQMYGDVVMGLKPVSKEEHDPFEVVIDALKEQEGRRARYRPRNTNDLKELVLRFKGLIRERIGREFPTDPWEQLWGSVMAVFQSWNNDRAEVVYRELNDIPKAWGTAVNVQAMVFGNLGDNSGTGVAFTRDAGTGEDLFNGEFLINAQGEDVVAGIRTPQQITLEGSRRWAQLAMVSEEDRRSKFPSLEELMPDIYQQLWQAETKLENHYHDMQDVEFTIQEGRLWMLQTRNGKRTGAAMVRIAMEMLRQGMIDEKEALLRVGPGSPQRTPAPGFRPGSDQEGPFHCAWPAGFAGRRYRTDRVLCRRSRRMGQQGQGRDPGAPGNLARRPARHERRQRHSHRPRRHDLARGSGRARHGQVLRLRRRRGACRLPRAHDVSRW
jgi:pyruvate,orthophosphate dikinase